MSDIILSNDIYETVRIKDHTGKVLSEFSFNPSDANIIERFENFSKGFGEIKKQIEEYESANNSLDYSNNMEKLNIINKNLHERLDYLLNTNAAESIFSVMGALSPLPSGEYYFSFILDQIGKKITNATGARIKKMDLKIQKHTAKYHK